MQFTVMSEDSLANEIIQDQNCENVDNSCCQTSSKAAPVSDIANKDLKNDLALEDLIDKKKLTDIDDKTPLSETVYSCEDFANSIPLEEKPKMNENDDGENLEKTPPVPPRSKKRRVAELKCSEVRWFYRRKVVDTKWIPFKGLDSLRLEIWWRNVNSIEIDKGTSANINQISPSTTSVVVFDGLYYVSDDMKSIKSLYWKDDEMEIRRGTWLLAENLQPIDPAMADPIEEHHLLTFRSQVIPDGAVFSDKESSKKPILTELKLKDQYEVHWNSVIDITLYNNSKTSRFLRYITWGKGTSLKRGYEEANLEDGQTIISHLVLVIHGIGQKGYENLIAKNTDQVREALYAILDKYYPEEKSKPMVLPVEWRAALLLDEGLTDLVTLPKMSSMRNALNSIAMDIMYYQSPLYRNEIMAGLIKSLNTVYSKFISNHPNFDGKVSLYAHSLGSVMCYDILTNWSPLVLYDKYVAGVIEDQTNANNDKNAEVFKEFQKARLNLLNSFGDFQKAFLHPDEKLAFRVSNVFCVGSPLAVFLIMRGASLVTDDNVDRLRIYNVFHPYDPVAYRLEPLFHGQYRLIRPIKLFSSFDLRSMKNYDHLPLELHKSYIKKMKAKEKREKDKLNKVNDGEKVDHDDLEEEDECDSDESSALRPNSQCSSPRSLTPPPQENNEQRKSWWKFGGGGTTVKKDNEQPVKEIEEVKLNVVDKILEEIPQENRLPYRLDYQLQPQITDRSYWSVLKSHFAYWSNADLAGFIINRLYSKESKITNALHT